ncbi:MAG TPA: DUF881 domain-containing protein [Kineosporiaceae bacterium]|nr:DUF881 domain-containing protein [Kineosporiaceae bacterium]
MGWKRVLRRIGRILRRPRLTRAHLLAGLLLGLLGFSLVVQARQTQSEGLSSLSQSELVKILDTVTNQSERLDAQARELQQTSEKLRSGSDQAAAAEEATRARLEVLGILAGTLPAEGPGVTLRIDDPQSAVDAAELLDTVQELRDAGAEAIQIGSVRVVASTSFVDPDPGTGGVVVDGTTLSAPFVFTAIGDPPTLDTALDIPGGVLETLRQDGARGTVRKVDKLTVSAIHLVRQPEFAVPNTDN